MNPRFLPHVLVITSVDGEKEFDVEHPEGCPVVCDWSPYMREIMADVQRRFEDGGLRPGLIVSYERRDCYVDFEVQMVGLDGLDLGDDPPDDGTYTPASQWSMDGWRRLPVGRYIIEGWHRVGTGLQPWGEDESEGGLRLLGKETP